MPFWGVVELSSSSSSSSITTNYGSLLNGVKSKPKSIT